MPSNLNLRLRHPLANCAGHASVCLSSSEFVPRQVIRRKNCSSKSLSSWELLLKLAAAASDRDWIEGELDERPVFLQPEREHAGEPVHREPQDAHRRRREVEHTEHLEAQEVDHRRSRTLAVWPAHR